MAHLTLVPKAGRRCVGVFVIVSLIGVRCVWSQATGNLGGVEVTVRFEVGSLGGITDPVDCSPQASDCGIKSILEANPFFQHILHARSVAPTSYAHDNNFFADNVPGTPLSDTQCESVEALGGIAWNVYSLGTAFANGGAYYFQAKTSGPVYPFAQNETCLNVANPVQLAIEECPGLARVHFVDEDAWNLQLRQIVPVDPLGLTGMEFDAYNGYPYLYGVQAQKFVSPVTSGVVEFPVLGNVSPDTTRIGYQLVAGSDPFYDQFVVSGTAIAIDDAESQVVPCNHVRDFYIPWHSDCHSGGT